MTYAHLSQTERYQIHALMKAGHNQAEIAQILGRHKSTICRELTRGSGRRGYRPRQAQHLSEERLRCQKKRRKRYASGHDRRGQIPHRRSILERPKSVEQRPHIGHWEGDTVIGAAHQHAIVTLVKRKSGFAVVTKVERKTSEQVSAVIIKRLEPIASRVKTITFDNGKEFAGHRQIDESLGSTAYFADPFASWQRGSNENFNGLLRQYIPKKRHLSTVSDVELKMIEDLLNHRPRKRLGFKTPHQVFHESLNRVALRN
jgi:IS30 family transposase